MNVFTSVYKLYELQKKMNPYDWRINLFFKTGKVLVKTGFSLITSRYNRLLSQTQMLENRMYIYYRHTDGGKYTIVVNKKRKRDPKEYYTCRYDNHDNEPCKFCVSLKEYIKIFQGPFNDFHGSSLRPMDLKLNNLIVYTADDDENTLVRFERDELFTSS